MGTTEKKMYKVLRHVGVKRNYIIKARNIDDLYLDDFDRKLLLFYFENEFNIYLKEAEVAKLTNLKALHQMIESKKYLLN